MPNAVSSRMLVCSLALLAWASYPQAAAAHAHGHWGGHVYSRDDGFATADSLPNDGTQHINSRVDRGISGSNRQAASMSASTAVTSPDGAAQQRRRLHTATDVQHSDASAALDPAPEALEAIPRSAAAALPVHIQLAAAAKADIAAKTLRARKADMYPGSPARRALAEDPNLAVRCVPCHLPLCGLCLSHSRVREWIVRDKLALVVITAAGKQLASYYDRGLSFRLQQTHAGCHALLIRNIC